MKKLFCLVLMLAALTVGAHAAFVDVGEDHWAVAAIDEMTDLQVVNGFPDGTFHPNDTLTRSQFLAMVVRAAAPEGADTSDEGFDWWYGYRNVADDYALLEKLHWERTGEDMDAPISRLEAAELLVRANEQWNGLRLTATTTALSFQDRADIPADFSTSVLSATTLGLLEGYPDGTFRGEKTLTRAEGCTLIQRLLHQKTLLADGEMQIANTGGYLIKYHHTEDGGAVLTSVCQSDGQVVQTLEVPMDGYADMEEMRRENPELWNGYFGRAVTGVTEQSFWGLAGYYTYTDDGHFRQWTDRAVLNWQAHPAGDGILAISDQTGTRNFFYGGGVLYPAGNEVLWIHSDGTVETLLSNTPAHGLNLTEITGAEDGVVRVKHEFVMGMADFHSYEYAVENGKLRALVHTPGMGYAGYTEEEAEVEQARLDEAGCGVGSAQ